MTVQRFTVADVMTPKVVAVRRGAEFKEIVAALERWKVTAVPVLEGEGRVVGVVSEADLLLRGNVVEHLFPLSHHRVDVQVEAGVVTLTGGVGDSSLIPLAARLAQAVEGVVDVRCRLTGAAG
ncbi:CBS domain-containing protein [Streptomyces sp. LMG1-1-1.1]|uniref:CBS domain-containing protein n=1 Tax=Streptomyces sp. LMG1-1-1.1 TaxID=3135245 RepID=UPI0034659631